MTQSRSVDDLLEENARLREELEALKAQVPQLSAPLLCSDGELGSSTTQPQSFCQEHDLSKQEVERYSRQLLLPAFSVYAQSRLSRSSVLVVGCGGLGSPCALYLAAAGVGRLGLVDHDAVELSNLHRQIIHNRHRVGMHKATSAAISCNSLNELVSINVHKDGLDNGNAVDIVDGYDVVVDASDNAPTRYLISDACVMTGKPLVSGAAIGTDGQLTVYNHGPDGPCYRCLFPEPPAAANCSRCADAGVLGVVPGVIGVLQALEAIKIVAEIGEVLSRQLVLFDALRGSFQKVKLRAKKIGCFACGEQPGLTRTSLSNFDYATFTGQSSHDKGPTPLQLLPADLRVEASVMQAEMAAALEQGQPVVVVDVRPETQFRIMSLPGAVNVPMKEFDQRLTDVVHLCGGCDRTVQNSQAGAENVTSTGAANGGTKPPPAVYVVCRRGNDSQIAVNKLHQMGVTWARDLVGGYTSWAQLLDPSMPQL